MRLGISQTSLAYVLGFHYLCKHFPKKKVFVFWM
jgi:hypothetical protein